MDRDGATSAWRLSELALCLAQHGVPAPDATQTQSRGGRASAAGHSVIARRRGPQRRSSAAGGAAPVRYVLLNRHYLTQALRYGLTELRIEDETSPVVFTEAGRKFIIMPIRLQPTPPPPTAAKATDETTPQSETEATAPASPSAEQSEPTPAVERNPMPETTLTPPRRGNLQPPVEAHPNHNGNGHTTPLAAAISQIETVKTGLRDVITELNATLDLLRAAEKEKKASFKEVESVRATLRSLQKVAI